MAGPENWFLLSQCGKIMSHSPVGRFNPNIENQHDKLVVEFWIGLLDKNGKEIYEGDIVKAPAYGRDAVCEVVWKMNCWVIRQEGGAYTGLTNYGGEFAPEVIGTIHENPELLKDEESPDN